MERYFLQARIRLVYYLYAFFAAGIAVSVPILASWPQEASTLRLGLALVIISYVTALGGVLSWLSWHTVRNWNVALDRYARWKRRVLEETYGARSSALRHERIMDVPMQGSTAGSPWATEVSIAILFSLASAASLAATAVTALAIESQALVALSAGAPALISVVAIATLLSPGVVKGWIGRSGYRRPSAVPSWAMQASFRVAYRLVAFVMWVAMTVFVASVAVWASSFFAQAHLW